MALLVPYPKKTPLGLRIIGSLKLLEAASLMALAFGMFHLLGTDLSVSLDHFVRRLHLDPENKLIDKALAGISGISQGQLRAIDAGTALYALLYVVEGIGLLMNKHWAEYLTIFATASLIPLEFYELARKVSSLRLSLLIVNIAIVAYLIYRLIKDRRAPKH